MLPIIHADENVERVVSAHSTGDGAVVLVLATTDGERLVRSIDLATGTRRWERGPSRIPANQGEDEEEAVVADGNLLRFEAAASEDLEPGRHGAELVATARDGRESWRKRVVLTAWTRALAWVDSDGDAGSTEQRIQNQRVSVANGMVFVADSHDLLACAIADGRELFRTSLGADAFAGTAAFEGDSLQFTMLQGLGTRGPDGRLALTALRDFPVHAEPDGFVVFGDGEIVQVRDGWNLRTDRLDHASVVVGEDVTLVKRWDLIVVRHDGMRMPGEPEVTWPIQRRGEGFLAENGDRSGLVFLDPFGRAAATREVGGRVSSFMAMPDGGALVASSCEGERRIERLDSQGNRVASWPAGGCWRLHLLEDGSAVASGAGTVVRVPP